MFLAWAVRALGILPQAVGPAERFLLLDLGYSLRLDIVDLETICTRVPEPWPGMSPRPWSSVFEGLELC